MAKFMSAPPASQSPGMAIEKNPYASDEVGGYNMFSGNYEHTRDSLWSRLIKVLRDSGQPAPPKQEFDQYYDSMAQGSPMADAGAPMAQGEQDWRMMEGAPASDRKAAEGQKSAASEASWQRMLKSLKASAPKDDGTLPPLPPAAPSPVKAAEPDMMDKPMTSDYDTREEYEAALREWESAGKNYF